MPSPRKSHEDEDLFNSFSAVDIEGWVFFSSSYNKILAYLIANQGAADRLSQARLQLIRRFAATAAIAHQMEEHLARGEDVNVTEYVLLCNTLVRIAHIIGVDPTTRNRTPSLTDYLRAQNKE
jgi:hypothetical protein